jgi:hypothetical protein
VGGCASFSRALGVSQILVLQHGSTRRSRSVNAVVHFVQHSRHMAVFGCGAAATGLAYWTGQRLREVSSQGAQALPGCLEVFLVAIDEFATLLLGKNWGSFNLLTILRTTRAATGFERYEKYQSDLV